jgi:hypothetical protein
LSSGLQFGLSSSVVVWVVFWVVILIVIWLCRLGCNLDCHLVLSSELSVGCHLVSYLIRKWHQIKKSVSNIICKLYKISIPWNTNDVSNMCGKKAIVTNARLSQLFCMCNPNWNTLLYNLW